MVPVQTLWKRVALVVASLGAAVGIMMLFPAAFRGAPNLLFLACIAVCARFAGRMAAIASILLSVVVGFVLAPQIDTMLDAGYFIRLLLFILMGVLLIYLIESMNRASQEAVERSEWLRVTLASIGDAVVATDTDGNVTLMNATAENLTGWRISDALGQPLERIFPIFNESDGGVVENPVARVLRDGQVVGLGNHTVLADRQGRRIPIEDSAAPIRDRQGRILGTILVFHDVTDERRSANALRESEARFRAMSDTAPVMIWTSGSDKQCDYFNQPWLEFTGRTMAQEYGAGWAEGIHPDDHDRCLEVYTTSFDARQRFQMEYRLRRHDGEYRWVLDTGIPRSAPDGAFTGYIGSCLDVTEQKQTLAYTQRLQALTSALSSAVTPVQVADVIVNEALQAMGGHLAGVALLSDDGHTVTYINQVGRSANLIRDFTVIPVETPSPMTTAIRSGEAQWLESREAFVSAYANLEPILSDAEPIRSIVTLPLRVEGRIIGGTAFAFPFVHVFSPGERAFILAIADQCALALERARLFQAEQQARHDAEKANDLKLQFLALVSHELRTPLASIKGFASTLLAEDIRFEPEMQQSFIQIIDEEADKLTELVEQLLDLSRLHAGNLRIRPEVITFGAIVDTAMAQFETLTTDHQLIIHLPLETPKVLADGPRIAQVLVNLVGNATKFAPLGSQITLSARHQDGMLRVEVSDQGPGIPVEARQYVFDAFRQVDRDTPLQKGAGLGLAICRGLIEQHGGHIWIEDRPGPGTTFAFTVPLM